MDAFEIEHAEMQLGKKVSPAFKAAYDKIKEQGMKGGGSTRVPPYVVAMLSLVVGSPKKAPAVKKAKK
jgi:hypothetical protein